MEQSPTGCVSLLQEYVGQVGKQIAHLTLKRPPFVEPARYPVHTVALELVECLDLFLDKVDPADLSSKWRPEDRAEVKQMITDAKETGTFFPKPWTNAAGELIREV